MSDPIDASKIIGITGSKEGVGKSLIALNLAILRAYQTGKGVVLIDMDPLCRGDLLSWTGVTQVLTFKELLDFYQKAGGGVKAVDLVRGKIVFGRVQVAIMPLGLQAKDVIGKFNPVIVSQLLSGLSRHFDVFLDVECASGFLPFAMDLADQMYWVVLPQRPSIAASIAMFEDLRNEHFPLDRIEIIVNQFNIPGAMRTSDIEQAFQVYNKNIRFLLPWEEVIPHAANSMFGYLAHTSPADPWVKSLRFVASHIKEFKPKGPGSNVTELLARLSEQNNLWKLEGAAEHASVTSAAQHPSSEAQVTEAVVDPQWDKLKEDVHGQVVVTLETQRIRVGTDAAGAQKLRSQVESIIGNTLDKRTDLELTRDQRERFIQELVDEILGLGPLETLLRDPSVSEIMVNCHNKIYIERKGKLTLTALRFRSDDQLIEAIKRIVAPLGRRIDESVPLVDARLKDGSRVNAIIPPLAVSGPTLTIRRFSAKPFGEEDLIRMNALTKEIIYFIKACVHTAKNVVVSGGTGTGKTTFLNLISSYIPSDERILTIEDVAELRLQQQHWIRLETRPPNIEGKGEVTIRDLVKNALRMRPDRIVVGECRGGEAVDMLQAMNTGHDGSMTTLHSNTPKDALNRMESMCLMSGLNLPVWVLREMIASAVNIIVQLTRMEDGSRRVTSVVEILGRTENEVKTQEIFKFVQTGISPEGKVLGYHTATGILPACCKAFKSKGVDMPESTFAPNALAGNGQEKAA
ncbi:MAG: ATPase, T2SS/T4P/T4SS family [Elusimicrobiota bacterium]